MALLLGYSLWLFIARQDYLRPVDFLVLGTIGVATALLTTLIVHFTHNISSSRVRGRRLLHLIVVSGAGLLAWAIAIVLLCVAVVRLAVTLSLEHVANNAIVLLEGDWRHALYAVAALAVVAAFKVRGGTASAVGRVSDPPR